VPLHADMTRAREVAERLLRSAVHRAAYTEAENLANTMPDGIAEGSAEHLLFLTLTISLNYQRDAHALWESSGATFNDPNTRYLFYPEQVHAAPLAQIISDLEKYGLLKDRQRDARIWKILSDTFHRRWNGDPRNFLEACSYDAAVILRRLKHDRHVRGNRMVYDYPNLRGPKIGALWIRVLRDNAGIEFEKLEQVPIPADRHVTLATVTTGVIRGRFSGRLQKLFPKVREAWFQSVDGLTLNGKPVIALDMDKPLWRLSKQGCSAAREACEYANRCPVRTFCLRERVRVERNFIQFDTSVQ